MRNVVSCQNADCGKKLLISKSLIGKKVRCKHCNQSWYVDSELFGETISDSPQGNENSAVVELESTQTEQETLISRKTLSGVRSREDEPSDSIQNEIVSVAPNEKGDVLEKGESAGKFGRYLIRDRLGAGAFGSVYRAFDPQLDREVALKVPHASIIQNAKRVERFFREARFSRCPTRSDAAQGLDGLRDLSQDE